MVIIIFADQKNTLDFVQTMFSQAILLALFVASHAQNLTYHDGRLISITDYSLCQNAPPHMNESERYCFVDGRPSILCRRPEPSCQSGQKVATGFILGYRDGAFEDHNSNCTSFLWLWSCAHDWRICLNGTVCVCNETTADPSHPLSLCNCSSSHMYETNTCTNNPTVTPTAPPTMAPIFGPTMMPTLNPTMMSTMSPTVSPTMGPTSSPTMGPTSSPTIVSAVKASQKSSENDKDDFADVGMNFWIIIAVSALCLVLVVTVVVLVFKRKKTYNMTRTVTSAFENPVYGDVHA
jgi:hypothetical protein